MALVRWEPARELNSLQQEMNRLFGTFFEGSAAQHTNGATARRWIPAMDLVEADQQYVLHADLPGMTGDDVKIEFEDNVLTISGERRSEHTERTGGFVRVERATGSFTRSLTLPAGIEAAGIEASFTNGVLEVRIPKPAERKPHRVAVGTATVEGTESAPAPEDTQTPSAVAQASV